MKSDKGQVKHIPVKVSLIGSYDVGKTSLVNRFVREKFNKDIDPTIGGTFAAKSISTKTNELVTLQLWDTAGSEKFKSLIPTYLRGSHCVLICFDNRDWAMDTVLKGVKTVEQYNPSAKIFLVRTKKDLAKGPADDDIVEFAKKENYKIYSTSSLTGVGVMELFEDVATTGLVLKKSELGTESVPLDYQQGRNREPYPPTPDGYIAHAGACCIIM